jgi:oligopeptidase A
MHAKDRTLREKVYRAYLSRASEFSQTSTAAEGKGDNAPLIETILALRREKALLLGYASFAEVSVSPGPSPSQDVTHSGALNPKPCDQSLKP